MPRLSALKTTADFRAHTVALGLHFHVTPSSRRTNRHSPTASPSGRSRWEAPLPFSHGRVGRNDRRHADRYGPQALAKLRLERCQTHLGGEAFAVCPEGRANPNQLMAREETEAGIAELRRILVSAHRERFTSTDDLLVGLQLTHSGRFCRPFRRTAWSRTFSTGTPFSIANSVSLMITS